jgi:FMN reductase
MVDVVTIAGSPAAPSRCAAVLDRTREQLSHRGLTTGAISLRELEPRALLHGDAAHAEIRAQIELLQSAQAVVIATPVYKAAYSGLLKVFLDLLPSGILTGKPVLPIATAGSLAHLLVLDYALKPVLASLGARHILTGVCVLDADFEWEGERFVRLVETSDLRLTRALDELHRTLPTPHQAHRHDLAV